MGFYIVGFELFREGRRIKVITNNPIYVITAFLSVQPGFCATNRLYLSKVYLKLEQKDKARHWLQKAADYKPKNQEDVDVSSGCI